MGYLTNYIKNSVERPDGDTLKQFMRKVDAHVNAICGLSSADLADMDFYSRWEDGVPPREVALELLENEGFPMEEI